jgi:hypothetical protein
MSYFIDDLIIKVVCKRKDATHFVLYNGTRARYFISLNSQGKKILIDNIATYSRKLSLLLKLLIVIPFQVLKIAKKGEFVTVEMEDNVNSYIRKVAENYLNLVNFHFNIIVGTYVDKQKQVFKCFSTKVTIYFKVGNQNSDIEMVREMEFLKNSFKKVNTYQTFDVPELIDFKKITEGKHFNIQVTKEFKGDKVEPIMTEEIYKIFQEISGSCKKIIVDGEEHYFSHGDFVPWNIRKYRDRYIVYDWEYCGFRFYGYDLIHYLYQIESLLNGIYKSQAAIIAVSKAKKYEPKLQCEDTRQLAFKYLKEASIVLN